MVLTPGNRERQLRAWRAAALFLPLTEQVFGLRRLHSTNDSMWMVLISLRSERFAIACAFQTNSGYLIPLADGHDYIHSVLPGFYLRQRMRPANGRMNMHRVIF